MALYITEEARAAINAHGERGYPNEICGLLLGKDAEGGRTIRALVPVENSFEADEQYHRFSIDPLQQLKAEKAAEKEGLTLLGYYHSHPDHPARPSEYDRTHVPPWNFYSHVIVAIEKKQPAAMTCWVFNEESEQFDEQAIAVE